LRLRDATARAGFELRERLSVYPEYVVGREGFLTDSMRRRAQALTDADGLVRPELEPWRLS